MSCKPIDNSKGQIVGWICPKGHSQITPCDICGKPSTKLCDYPTLAGTCDKPLCNKHAHHTSKDIDYCKEHYNLLVEAQTTL